MKATEKKASGCSVLIILAGLVILWVTLVANKKPTAEELKAYADAKATITQYLVTHNQPRAYHAAEEPEKYAADVLSFVETLKQVDDAEAARLFLLDPEGYIEELDKSNRKVEQKITDDAMRNLGLDPKSFH